MQRRVPRLVLAGTNSGCGKTTVTCAVLQALISRGLRVGAAKCGPDYIDPMFHSRVIGAKSSNLDSFFFDRDTMRYLLAHNTQGCDVTVIEGVMGYYDGLGLTSTRASTYAAARETSSPVVLVVNARGAALSVLASVEGFLHFAPDSGIQGVILNGCSAMSYGPLSRELENRLGVRACGYLPRLPECALESRHLGLITADEVADLQEKLRKLAAVAEKTLDFAALLSVMGPDPVYQPLPRFPAVSRDIAVVCDKAIPVGDLEECIRRGAKGLLKAVELFDIYTGIGVPEGKKSVAFRLTLRADDRSLTAEEADADVKSILAALESELGARLR